MQVHTQTEKKRKNSFANVLRGSKNALSMFFVFITPQGHAASSIAYKKRRGNNSKRKTGRGKKKTEVNRRFGDGSEVSRRCVQGNLRADSDKQQIRTELLSYSKSFPSFTSAQSSCDYTNQATHAEENLFAIRVKDVCADQKIKSKYRKIIGRRSRKKKSHICIFLWKTAAGTDSLCHSLIISSRVNPADGNLKPSRSISLFNEM